MSKQLSKAKTPLRQVRNVKELLINDTAREQLQIVAAQHMRPERMMRLMANAIRTTPKLGQCEPLSLLGALMTCASLGLEPNTVLGHAYLIPFENRKKGIVEVQLVIGYKGMIDLARRSGHIVNIHADVVYEGDEFSFEYGSGQHLRHVPAGERTQPTHAYCHAKLTDGEAFIVIPYPEILKVRDASQGYKTAIRYDRKDSPWIAFEHQMARKTAVRALFAELPISIEKVTDALGIDGQAANFANFAMQPAETGAPVIEGEAALPPEEAEQEEVEEEAREETGNEPGGGEKSAAPKKKQAGENAPDIPDETSDADADADADADDSDGPAGLIELVARDLKEAQNPAAIDAVIEIYGGQIDQLNGTPAGDEIYEAVNARRAELIAAHRS